MSKFSEYFNSTTFKGRANVAKATYASFAAIYLYSRFRNKNRSSNENAKRNENANNQTQIEKPHLESPHSHNHVQYHNMKDNEASCNCECSKESEKLPKEDIKENGVIPSGVSPQQNQGANSLNGNDITNKRSIAVAAAVIQNSRAACESSDNIKEKTEFVSFFPFDEERLIEWGFP
ncbi:uncharacterized protein LOC106084427 [Stomoxys calcitrans]|uniref:uncharacterized protein LOC106084427 n=1 Tax=Stomoxys calcitrans TaxID=35570 RepID=UPI0027E371A8|nr:uncharacterized protein LOC106084427 [Stomoxys calcitrans]